MSFDTIASWLNQHQSITQMIMASGLLLLSLVSYFITKHYIIKAVLKLVEKTKTKLDDILLKKVMLRRLAFIVPLIFIYSFASVFPWAENIIRKVSVALISLFVLLTIGTLLTALGEIYLTLEVSKGRPIKGYIQVSKLIIYVIGVIIIISTLVGRSPLVLLSSFGAMTAVILLIFRDTILSFVASIQITSNDLVRVGDWIEVPTYGADGDVVDIALHTVKIQNWNKTFTIIPTHKLLEVTFNNWRGMQVSGGRRIKRAIYIDMASIKFCDDEMIERFKAYQLIVEYVQNKQEEIERYNEENDVNTDVLVMAVE